MSPTRRGYQRSADSGLEFERAAFFSDAVFAIAMTLLVVPVVGDMPRITDNSSMHTMWHALDTLSPSFFAFFIGFFVIGRYWSAHHAFFGLLVRVDRGFLTISLVFLSVIAFLPFPTFLIGHFESNPASVVVYSGALLLASGLEILLIWWAHEHQMFEPGFVGSKFRFYLLGATTPLPGFLISVPVALAVGPGAGLLCYLLGIPAGAFLTRRFPADANALDEAEGTN